MPRYSDIPTAQKFKDDSSVLVAVRSSDKTLGQIDRLLADYQGSTATDQVTILYYLYLAAKFWRKNVGATLKNTPPSGFSDLGNTLPGTGKVSGNEGRRDAVTALSDILEEKLLKQFAMEDSAKLPEHLAELYGCANHGVASDADWLSNPSSKDAKNYTVYLTDDGMRRRYKLHFRSGLAYRWKDVSDTTSGYVKFDTNDNHQRIGKDRSAPGV